MRAAHPPLPRWPSRSSRPAVLRTLRRRRRPSRCRRSRRCLRPSRAPPIASIAPQGDADTLAQIRVRFSDDLIPLQRLESPDETAILAHFSIEPALPGRFRFLTPRMIGFEADRAWPAATRVRVTIAKGLHDLHGHALADDVAWTFQTPGDRARRPARGNSTPRRRCCGPPIEFDVQRRARPRLARSARAHPRARRRRRRRSRSPCRPTPRARARRPTRGRARRGVRSVAARPSLRAGARDRAREGQAVRHRHRARRAAARRQPPERPRVHRQAAHARRLALRRPRSQPGGPVRRRRSEARVHHADRREIAGRARAEPRAAQRHDGLCRVRQPTSASTRRCSRPTRLHCHDRRRRCQTRSGRSSASEQHATFRTGDLTPDVWAPGGTNLFPASRDVRLNVVAVNAPPGVRATFRALRPVDVVQYPDPDAYGNGDVLGDATGWPRFDAQGPHNVERTIEVPLRAKLGAPAGALAYGVRAKLPRQRGAVRRERRRAADRPRRVRAVVSRRRERARATASPTERRRAARASTSTRRKPTRSRRRRRSRARARRRRGRRRAASAGGAFARCAAARQGREQRAVVRDGRAARRGLDVRAHERVQRRVRGRLLQRLVVVRRRSRAARSSPTASSTSPARRRR